jgi:hypothetical protein
VSILATVLKTWREHVLASDLWEHSNVVVLDVACESIIRFQQEIFQAQGFGNSNLHMKANDAQGNK